MLRGQFSEHLSIDLESIARTGWLVFETKARTDKRRLYPIPRGWSELPAADLVVLLNKAEVVPPRKLRAERLTGEAAAREVQRAHDFVEQTIDSPEMARRAAGQETPDVTDLSVVRSFRYPAGRLWSACVVQESEDSGSPVLRFSAGPRHIDLYDWPKDWPDYEDEELVNLLRRALRRDTTEQLDTDAPRRRWDDSSPPVVT
jgi:hypothetical protein